VVVAGAVEDVVELLTVEGGRDVVVVLACPVPTPRAAAASKRPWQPHSTGSAESRMRETA
jgi:hypothetical protein